MYCGKGSFIITDLLRLINDLISLVTFDKAFNKNMFGAGGGGLK